MWSLRNMRAASLGLLGVGVMASFAIAAALGPAGKKTAPAVSPAPAPQDTSALAAREQDTAANLQMVFNGEVNAKQRYVEFAKQADREGYPGVAQLFRACARAEQAHADQHVHAIAWVGGEARGMIQRLQLGSTEENLAVSRDAEIYESTQLYPAVIERARADHQSTAVRSANYALSAEREHATLVTAALASLASRAAPHPLYVCPVCGKTVESLDFKKCPNCFTSTKRFIAVS